MRSVINNFRVKSLLLSGDFICSSEDNNLYLLSQCSAEAFSSHQLAAFKSPPSHIIFPVQIDQLISDKQHQNYACYPLREGLVHCLTKGGWLSNARKRGKYMCCQLAAAIAQVWSNPDLRTAMEQCADVQNIWVEREGVSLMWIKRAPHQQSLSEERIVKKLAQLFYYLLNGKPYAKGTSSKLIFHIKKNPTDKVVFDMLEGRIQIQQLPQLFEEAASCINEPPRSRYDVRTMESPLEEYLIPRKRRSIERTELSLKKSFELVEGRRRPDRLIEQKVSNYESMARRSYARPLKPHLNHRHRVGQPKASYQKILEYSDALRLSDNKLDKGKAARDALINSMSYRLREKQKLHSPDSQSNRTEESMNSEISRMLRERALDAYKKERSHSIFDQHHAERTSSKVDCSTPVKLYTSLNRRNQATLVNGRVDTQQSRYRPTYNTQKRVHTEEATVDQRLLFYLERQADRTKRSQQEHDKLIANSQRFQSLCLPQASNRKRLVKDRTHYRRPAEDLFPKINTFIFNSSNFTSRIATQRSTEKTIEQKQPPKRLISEEVTNRAVKEQKESAEFTKGAEPPMVQETIKSLQQQDSSTVSNNKKATPKSLIEKQKEEPVKKVPVTHVTRRKNSVSKEQPLLQEKVNANSIIAKLPLAIKTETVESEKQLSMQSKPDNSLREVKKVKQTPSESFSQFVNNAINLPLGLQDEQNELEVIHLSKPLHKPVQVIPTKIIQAAPLDTERITKEIVAYIDLINIIGYAAGPAYKAVVKSVPKIRPFTNLFFIYKRFFRERQKCQKWLINEKREFTRPGREGLDQHSYRAWLKLPERQQTQVKVAEDNKRIEGSIVSMQKKLASQNKDNPRLIKLSDLNSADDIEQTTVAIQQGVRIVDEMLELQQMSDDMLHHMVNVLDALFIMSELDGRLVRAVDPAHRKKSIQEDIHEYFINQETKVALLKKIYKL